MPRFAANIFYLFRELPLLERFDAAGVAGFKAIEYPYPYQTPIEDSRARLDAAGLEVIVINAPVGDWRRGERGMAALPGREDEFEKSIEEAIVYATALGCRNVHVMAGAPTANIPDEQAMNTLAGNLKFAAEACLENGLRVLIEPINPVDLPGYFIGNLRRAIDVLKAVGSDNLFLLYDLYHAGMNGESPAEEIEANIDLIVHMQVAGVPGRAEPEESEISFPELFDTIDSIGYTGWIGCEYNPRAGTFSGLDWAAPYGIGHARGCLN